MRIDAGQGATYCDGGSRRSFLELGTPQKKASGGEYQVQQGFGWTNGVTSRFYMLTKG